MKTEDFSYDLPAEFIAQTPAEPRDHSRLMVLERKVVDSVTGSLRLTNFYVERLVGCQRDARLSCQVLWQQVARWGQGGNITAQKIGWFHLGVPGGGQRYETRAADPGQRWSDR